MNKFFLSLVALTLLASSCSKKPITTISPIEQAVELSPKGMVYALPKTYLKVKVVAKYTEVIPGPYARYAQKYLGVENVPTSKKQSWSIQDVNVTSFNQADMQSLFVVEPSEEFPVDFLKIVNEGLVIPASYATFSSATEMAKANINSKAVNYVDLSPAPYIATEKTTHYSRVVQDSTFVRVPVHKSVVVERSFEEKAREAADFIFSLRKRRMELLAGDADFVAEGQAAKEVLKEITRLEEDYLTLFTGKVFSYTATHWFNFNPVANGSNSSAILFRFSDTRGVLPSSDLSGSPVLISLDMVDDWGGTTVLENLAKEKDSPRLDVVYYRLPVPMQVKISNSDKDFYSQVFTFHQFGPLLRIPKEYINKL